MWEEVLFLVLFLSQIFDTFLRLFELSYFAVFLVHLSRRLKCTIVINRCLSVVRRLSSLTFHIFDFFSKIAEQNSMKLDRKQDLNVMSRGTFRVV